MPRGKRNVPVDIKENQPNESILPGESNDDRLNMEAYKRDFDIQVPDRIKSMQQQLKKILADLSRLAKTENLKIDKDIRSLTLKEFVEKGGDLDILEFKELSTSLADVSYRSPQIDDTITAMQTQNVEANTTVSTVKKTTGTRKMLRGKREAPESSLVRHAMKNTRTRKNDMTTPLQTSNYKLPNKKQLVTPMFTPRFDPSKPLTAAREPKHGETLVSVAGSPVVKSQPDQPGDDSNLVSISLMSHQTVLGGRLFLDEGMSPNTLLERKQIIEEAVHAINSRLEELNSQVSTGSKLDES